MGDVAPRARRRRRGGKAAAALRRGGSRMIPMLHRIGCLSPAIAGLTVATLAAGPAHAQAKPPTANVENVIGQILVLIRDGSKKLSERLGELFAATSEIGPQAERVLSLMTDLNGLPVLWQ